jgi:hypothetical protein
MPIIVFNALALLLGVAIPVLKLRDHTIPRNAGGVLSISLGYDNRPRCGLPLQLEPGAAAIEMLA